LNNEAVETSVHREIIRDLVARYNSYGDHGKFDLLFELFVPEAVMEIRSFDGSTTRYEGLDEIKTIFTGTRERLQGETAESASPSYLRHFTTTHQIDLGQEGQASGRLYFQALMPHGLDHWGRYRDRYVVAEGRWRFAERIVRVDGRIEKSHFAR
jgi:3-phenylpropionate/cinnamic acid dioxygenase small subunit